MPTVIRSALSSPSLLLALLMTALAGSAGAQPPRVVTGNGVIEEQMRGTGHFNAVVLDIPNNVVLELGKSEGITVVTDENLQPLIETVVRDGALHIALAQADTCLETTVLKIQMQAKNLAAISVSGGGSFQVNGKLHIASDKHKQACAS